MTEPLADHAARAAALDPMRSFIVDAAAGSGKTALLTQRLLVLLARVKAPEEVVAITFTRKAAAEMRGRVLAALALADLPDDPDPLRVATQILARNVVRSDREFGWQLRENPNRLRIQTIDALTASLVRRMPLLSGLPANATVRDDPTELYRRAARRTLMEADDPNSIWGRAVGSLLRDLDNDWRRLEGLLVEMLARRDQWLALVVNPPSREQLAESLAGAVRAEAAALSAQCPPALRAQLVEFARWAGSTLAGRDPESPWVILKDFSGTAADVARWPLVVGLLFTQAGKPRMTLDKRHGVPNSGAEGSRFKTYYAQLIASLAESPRWTAMLQESEFWPRATYTAPEFTRLEALMTSLRLAAAQWRVVSAEEGETDFAEIALAALTVLGEPDNPTDLSLALDYRIAHLLVDEFQDTSRTQYALLERLTAGWVSGDGRTLFMVGDPLQSIYRFRDADVSLFTRTVAAGEFGGVALTSLRLSANFRTCRTVIDWFNQAFPQVFASSAIDSPQFHPIAATRADVKRSEVCVNLTDATTQPMQIIATIAAIRERDPAATVAILVRGRAHLSELLPALLAADLPVAATEIEPLHQVPVVNDLIALTRALYALTDRIAWLAVLRAPWCGLSLADLEAVIGPNNERLVWALITDPRCSERLSAAEFARLQIVIGHLSIALAARGRLDYTSLVTRTWHALRGPACVDSTALRYAERYFELLAQLEATGRELTAPVLAAEVSAHFAPLSASTEATIQIMTIHHAKGLEFDYVLLPELQRPVRLEPRRLLLGQGMAHESTGRVLAPIPKAGKQSEPIYEYLRRREQRRLNLETYRLLYVAMTRVRVGLYLFAATPSTPEPRQGTFLQVLWPALGAVPGRVARSTALSNAAVVPKALRRLAATAMPNPPDEVAWANAVAPAPLEFAWASPLAKHVGTVTHALLQDHASAATPPDSTARRRTILRRLRALGVSSPDLERAVQEVEDSVEATITSARGSWLLRTDHVDAHSEYRLTTVTAGPTTDVVIDRTFVDADGTRWIIDYKTGTHLGGDRDAFMASEVSRYRPQLETYAAFFRAIETRPIRLALYFPRLDGWREWSPGDAV